MAMGNGRGGTRQKDFLSTEIRRLLMDFTILANVPRCILKKKMTRSRSIINVPWIIVCD